MSKQSLRRERFEKVAARRVKKVLDVLDSLANCSNRGNYEYGEDDVKKMFNAIKERIKTSEAAFNNEINKASKNEFKF
jgi:hypothetical protein